MLSRFAFSRWLLLLVVGLLLVHPASVIAQEAEPSDSPVILPDQLLQVASGTEEVAAELYEKEEMTLRLNERIKAVGGFDSSLIGVTTPSADSLRIHGYQHGQTTIAIADHEDRLTKVTVTVKSRTLEKLRKRLQELFPDTKLQLVELNDSILIRGSVPSGDDFSNITDIATQFYPQVLNHLAINADALKTESTAIPAEIRAVTINVDEPQDVATQFSPGDRVNVDLTYSVRGERGNVTKTETFMEDVEFHAVHIDSGHQRVSLLVTPEEVGYILYADRRGKISLVPRKSAPPKRINEALFNELRNPLRNDSEDLPPKIDGDFQPRDVEAEIEAGSDAPTERLRGHTKELPSPPISPKQVVKLMPVSEIRPEGIGLVPGDRVDVLIKEHGETPDGEQTTISTVLEDVEISDCQLTVGQKPWHVSLLVPPVQAQQFNNRRAGRGRRMFSFILQGRSINLVKHPLASRPTLPKEQVPQDGTDAPPEQLRADIRALHADVKRLIELLEQRQSSTKPDVRHQDPLRAGSEFHAPASQSWPIEYHVTPSQPKRPNTVPPPVDARAEIPPGRKLFYFYADWVGESQKLKERINTIARQEAVSIHDIKVDSIHGQRIARQFDVTELPTLMLFEKEKEVRRTVDLENEKDIQEFVRAANQPIYDNVWNALGLGLAPLPPNEFPGDRAKYPGVYRGGMLITKVSEEFPHPDREGLKKGDILVGLGIYEVTNIKTVQYAIRQQPKASDSDKNRIKFYVVRDGVTLYGYLRIAPVKQGEEQVTGAADDDLSRAEKAGNSDELLFFQASWCGPCQKMAPVINAIDREGIIRVKKIDVDRTPKLAEQFGIISLPTLVRLENGKEIGRTVGEMTKEQIHKFMVSQPWEQGINLQVPALDTVSTRVPSSQQQEQTFKFHVGFTR